MVMLVNCFCGKDKPHGQMVWLRVEMEVPEPNNDEHYICSDSVQRVIGICRSCLKRKLTEQVKEKGKASSKGESTLLEVVRRRLDPQDIDDTSDPGVLDAVCSLLQDLHTPAPALNTATA